jgi:two-component system chemotaxis sensor kinase CheA
MSDQYAHEPLLDMFLFETSQLLEQLEQSILASEKESYVTDASINEIFRIMHTIKGSAAMMLFDNIAKLAHSIEDLFFFIRKEKPERLDCSALSDLVLEGVDFIKIEIEKIKNNAPADGNAKVLVESIHSFLQALKQEGGEAPEAQQKTLGQKQQYYISQNKEDKREYQYAYKAVLRFEEGCEMENIRAYTVIHHLKGITEEISYLPEDIIDSDESIQVIRGDGFQIYFKADQTYEQMNEFFLQTIFLKELELVKLEDTAQTWPLHQKETEIPEVLTKENPVKVPELVSRASEGKAPLMHPEHQDGAGSSAVQSIISVSVTKLDKLMDLVGEMVIAEAMVIENPDLKSLQLNNFRKAARQLNKITGEIQDMVMSIRMVPLSVTFTKMHRIVRDMSKRLAKEVHLDIIGEETEVDKNIIEHISDPLMHLVRNSVDHGMEDPEEREAKGKPRAGVVTLEAKNAGSDVLIIVRDDGKGLSREKILKKARENNLLFKNEEDMTDKEIFNLILLPGFSTKDKVTEYSGRGVGMDVVTRNIEAVGGSLTVDSIADKGTSITMKIPLTLAIIDGMNIKVGAARYTLPIVSIKESFRPKQGDVFQDPEGNEMIMVRGNCYQVRRLSEMYQVKTKITKFSDGIIIMVEQDEKTVCVFADELLGQQQVVVKALPQYIQSFKKIKGLAGCTLLGDGSISLILDVARIVNNG